MSIVLVDKPAGMTSFDVIRRLREICRKNGEKSPKGCKASPRPKMGHAGTLDPAASGLLIIGVGREGTKKLNNLVGLSKVYEVEVLLGVKTDTGDLDGEVMEEASAEDVTEEDVRRVLVEMVGTVSLPVPKYSAVKVDGKPLYKYAREGKEVEVPIKEMRIEEMSLRDVRVEDGKTVLDIEMRVGSGVYVRSIAEEIGRRCNVPATVKELRRTRVGDYRVEDALMLEEVEKNIS